MLFAIKSVTNLQKILQKDNNNNNNKNNNNNNNNNNNRIFTLINRTNLNI